MSQFETRTPSTFRCSLILQSVTVLQFPSDFFFFPFSSKRLTVLQDLVHRYVPFWRTMPWTVWSRKADSRLRQRLRLSLVSQSVTVLQFPWDFVFLLLQFQTTYRSAGPSSLLRSVLTDHAPQNGLKQESWFETRKCEKVWRNWKFDQVWKKTDSCEKKRIATKKRIAARKNG